MQRRRHGGPALAALPPPGGTGQRTAEPQRALLSARDHVPRSLSAYFKLTRAHVSVPEVVNVITGDYELLRFNHGRPVYQRPRRVRSLEPRVFLYYWDEEDPQEGSWWFGSAVGEDEVWAWNPEGSFLPPEQDWELGGAEVRGLQLCISCGGHQGRRDGGGGRRSRSTSRRRFSRSRSRTRTPGSPTRWRRPLGHDSAASPRLPMRLRRCASRTPERWRARSTGDAPAWGSLLALPARHFRSRSIPRLVAPQWSSKAQDGRSGAPKMAISNGPAEPRNRSSIARGITLRGKGLSDADLRRWIAGAGLDQLTVIGHEPLEELDLSQNDLTDFGVGFLVSLLLQRRQLVRRLKLFSNKLRAPNVLCELIEDEHMGAGSQKGLCELHLSHNDIGMDTLDKILESLRKRVQVVGSFSTPFWLRVERNPALEGLGPELVEPYRKEGLRVCLKGCSRMSGCSIRSCEEGADVHLNLKLFRDKHATPAHWHHEADSGHREKGDVDEARRPEESTCTPDRGNETDCISIEDSDDGDTEDVIAGPDYGVEDCIDEPDYGDVEDAPQCKECLEEPEQGGAKAMHQGTELTNGLDHRDQQQLKKNKLLEQDLADWVDWPRKWHKGAWEKELGRVQLAGCQLEDSMICEALQEALAQSGPGPGALNAVDLSCNLLTDLGAAHAVDFLLENRQATGRLKLFRNRLCEPRALCRLLEDAEIGCGAPKGLKELHLSNNGMTPRILREMVESVHRRARAWRGFFQPMWLRAERNPQISSSVVEDMAKEFSAKGLHICLEGGLPGSGCCIRWCRYGADLHLHVDGSNRSASFRR